MSSAVKKAKETPSTVTTHVVLFRMGESFTVELENEASEECAAFVGTIPGVLSSTFGRTFTTEYVTAVVVLVVVFVFHAKKLFYVNKK